MEWESGFMQNWQNDLKTLEAFCSDELGHYRKRIHHAGRITKPEEQEKVLSEARKSLDSMLTIAEKWTELPAFYSDFRDYLSEISSVREMAGKDNPPLEIEETLPALPEHWNSHDNIFASVLNYYKSRGVVGEERLSILQTLCAANKISFGVEGPSGSGKTFVMDGLINLLPEESVYKIGLSSDNAIFNDLERLNKAEFLYIPELQKAMDRKKGSTVEAIKDLTEGRDAVRIVTAKKGKCDEYRIGKGKALIYTLAHENGFKKDIETGRRFAVFYTDCSPEHVDVVLSAKARSRCSPEAAGFTENDFDDLRNHLSSCILAEYSFQDPFSVYMSRHIPNIPKAVGFVDHYYALLDACAKFNYPFREESNEHLFITLEDHYIIHQFYHNDFCRNLTDICGKDDIHLIESAKSGVNWKECWNAGVSVMNENFPDIAGNWMELQKTGNAITVYDPIKRKRLCLTGEMD